MRLLLLALALLSQGCAHTRVQSWGQGKVEVCGNKWSSAKDLEERARQSGCSSPRAVSGGLREDGTSVTWNQYGAQAHTTHVQCVTYSCE